MDEQKRATVEKVLGGMERSLTIFQGKDRGMGIYVELLSGLLKRSPEKWGDHMEASRDSLFVWEILRRMVKDLLEQDPEALATEPLSTWILENLGKEKPPRPKGGDPWLYRHRNVTIAGAVQSLKRLGYKPTSSKPDLRNQNSGALDARSGCHLVAERLKGYTYENTVRIWQTNREHLSNPAGILHDLDPFAEPLP
ncbi:hypothetical protein [Candidatus Palauibacter sp.]|uniref:hypothetical protein n=1 Tax=Candidatus Palauibacter sp. TaxID=3101350 RepID=UPI003AF2C7A6